MQYISVVYVLNITTYCIEPLMWQIRLDSVWKQATGVCVYSVSTAHIIYTVFIPYCVLYRHVYRVVHYDAHYIMQGNLPSGADSQVRPDWHILLW